MSNITADQIVAWIERYAARIAEEKDYLTKLDSDIGDADHGLTCPHARQQENRREQPRQQLHRLPLPQSNPVESGRL